MESANHKRNLKRKENWDNYTVCPEEKLLTCAGTVGQVHVSMVLEKQHLNWVSTSREMGKTSLNQGSGVCKIAQEEN